MQTELWTNAPINLTPHPPQLGEGGDLTLRLFKCPTSVDKFSIKPQAAGWGKRGDLTQGKP